MMEAMHDRELFEEKLAAVQAELYFAVCHMLAPDCGDAVDVVQNTNLALVRKWNSWCPARPFIAWAVSFAKVEVMRYRQAKSRETLVFTQEALDGIAEELQRDLSLREPLLKRLSACTQVLSGEHSSLLRMRYQERLKPSQIAKRLNLSPHKVTCRLAYIRSKLLDCIRGECTAAPENLADFSEWLEENPELPRKNFRAQAAMHFLLARYSVPVRRKRSAWTRLAACIAAAAFCACAALTLHSLAGKRQLPAENKTETTTMTATKTAPAIVLAAASALAAFTDTPVSAGQSTIATLDTRDEAAAVSAKRIADTRECAADRSSAAKIDTETPSGTVVILI